MFEFEGILKGFEAEEYAYALHLTLISYLDSIGILNQEKYHKFLNNNFDNTIKHVHEIAMLEAKKQIEKWEKGDK